MSRDRHTRFGVALEGQHNFRCTIPTRSNVFRHEAGVVIRIVGDTSSKTKVTNFQFAVGVDQKIAGLQIAMNNTCGMDVQQTAQELVNKVLKVRIGQGLAGADDLVKIRLHELLHNISDNRNKRRKNTVVNLKHIVKVVTGGLD